MLLTDAYVEEMIKKHLGEEKYNTELVLDFDKNDGEKLEEAERRRREKEIIMPSYHEEKPKGKGKKKSKLNNLISFFKIEWGSFCVYC